MARYAVSHYSDFECELTTEIIEASNPVEAIRRSTKARAQVQHVFDSPNECGFSTMDGDSQLRHLKQEAFNTEGMVHAEFIPDPV